VTARAPSSDPLVLDEFRRSKDARWIERSRSLSPTAYRWMKRRIARGLRFGVAARVEDFRGRILLVRMNPKTAWSRNWVAPGGGAEHRETPRQAILREIREETGVRVRDLRLWKVYHETLRTRSDAGLEWHSLQYTARWAAGRPHSLVPHEVVEARWFHRFPKRTEFRPDWLYPPRDPSGPKRTN
jgi:ADP-ribose pyrophosphatase YjhB (NUDIX family)